MACLLVAVMNFGERAAMKQSRLRLTGCFATLLGAFTSLCSVFFATEICAQTIPPEVLIMLDMSGSISDSDLAKEKAAVKGFLDFFVNQPSRPAVGIGSFNLPDGQSSIQASRILEGLTTEYGSSSTPSGLYAVLDGISPSSLGGWTDISSALDSAKNSLLANGKPSAKKFIVLVSDGIPNRPGTDYEACKVCGCDNAYRAAEVLAQDLRSQNINLITIHYQGNGSEVLCPDEPAQGSSFMSRELAFIPHSAYQGDTELTKLFERVACNIKCDDGDPCTLDSCDSLSGQCIATPDLSDLDSDGKRDCQDQCFGDESLIGNSCSQDFAGCQISGTFDCQNSRSLRCNMSSSDIVACLTCSVIDFSSAAKDLVVIEKDLSGITNKLVKVLRRKANRQHNSGKSSLIRRAKRLVRQTERLSTTTITALSSQDTSVLSCGSNPLCTTSPAQITQDVAVFTLKDIVKESRRAHRPIKTSKVGRRIRQDLKVITERIQSAGDLLPEFESICSQ
jgi:von Willebrand factor type A domain/Dictyostelium (slime mold) repeat